MKIIKPYVEQISPVIDGVEFLKRIERIGRVCYKSEDKITDESAPIFVAKLIKNGHEAMIEHVSLTVKFICDRGVTHEIVRHRLASYAQESTRYCNYSGGEIQFIQPCWFENDYTQKDTFEDLTEYPVVERDWVFAMLYAEQIYNKLITGKWKPQQARSVLPNSLKTEIVVTMNLREWRHFFKLRTAKSAHPQMQEVADMALVLLKSQIPIVFDDIYLASKYEVIKLREEK